MPLDDLRSRITELDQQILGLLSERARVATRIGQWKQERGLPVLVPERERAVLAAVAGSNGGPLTGAHVLAIWREILSACRALEGELTVAYLGPAGTFTHQAARERFGAAAAYRPVTSIGDIFDEVERGLAVHGVVPVENSSEGAVGATLDRLAAGRVVVCGEMLLPIAQHLLSRAERLDAIALVVSHPQGLGQCRGWLARHLPGVPTREAQSTAAAAESALADPAVAAIASEFTSQLSGVPILRARIEDTPHNTTRFLVLGRETPPPTGRDRTSIVFAMRNESGMLHRILEPFARRGLNLTKIESRPTRLEAWEYVIFVDLEGHESAPGVAEALGEARTLTRFLKVLGSYPVA